LVTAAAALQADPGLLVKQQQLYPASTSLESEWQTIQVHPIVCAYAIHCALLLANCFCCSVLLLLLQLIAGLQCSDQQPATAATGAI
jgi:hypothetical protein